MPGEPWTAEAWAFPAKAVGLGARGADCSGLGQLVTVAHPTADES